MITPSLLFQCNIKKWFKGKHILSPLVFLFLLIFSIFSFSISSYTKEYENKAKKINNVYTSSKYREKTTLFPIASTNTIPDAVSYTSPFTKLIRDEVQKIIPHTLIIKPGDTLAQRLRKEKIKENDIQSALNVLKPVYNPKKLQVGQKLLLYFKKNSDSRNDLLGIATKPSSEKTLIVTRLYNDDFKVRSLSTKLEKEVVTAKGVIQNSLYMDALAKGATDNAIAQFATLYAYSIDFQRDLHKGDSFELVFERYINSSGKPLRTGKLLYAMLTSRKKPMSYWYFESENGESGYYDIKGKSARKFLMKTPINGARLTSRFGMRRHPILGYTKKHKGIDFGAPKGTPIFAAGKGVIERIGRNGGYGKYIRIKHANQYKTAYAHMSSFKRGLKVSSRVSQGQVIGYVGTTGRSTGPHLHYEVLYKNVQVNPLRVKAPIGKALNSIKKKAFEKARQKIETLKKTAPPAKNSVFVSRN